MQTKHMQVGIDDMSCYVPRLYLPIEVLAEARQLEYAKLNKGLGLEAMALPDTHEDAATMAANAVLDIILKNGLDPRSIGRIYLGTESAVDGAKPMASYVMDMLDRYLTDRYGPDCLLNCDVVDLTFACIGAVDALENTLDWVRGDAGRIGIVVASDVAKYDLESGGEYTQGAGAVALLVKADPRLLAIGDTWGVATRGVHDFFKPVRTYHKTELVTEVLQAMGSKVPGLDPEALLAGLNGSLEKLFGISDEQLGLHLDMPVFDGPYSNQCYQNRIWEALRHYAQRAGLPDDAPVTDEWQRLVFHLPYAYQGRRMFPEIFMIESQRRGDWPEVEAEFQMERPHPAGFDDEKAYEKAYATYLRAVSKTQAYRRFVREKIERGERASSLVGNIYTGSIFLALMSTLEADLGEGNELAGARLGFFAYGSGSKSKVFTATVQPAWREVVETWQLAARLSDRHPVDYHTYEQLHRGRRREPVIRPRSAFYLSEVCREKGVREGARTYRWAEGVQATV